MVHNATLSFFESSFTVSRERQKSRLSLSDSTAITLKIFSLARRFFMWKPPAIPKTMMHPKKSSAIESLSPVGLYFEWAGFPLLYVGIRCPVFASMVPE